jgi:hypothetical protein
MALIPLALSVVLVAVVIVVVTRMAAEGRLARNGSAGIRTRHTQASDAAWVAGHAAALPAVRRAVPLAVVTLVLMGAAYATLGEGWGIGAGLLGLAAQTAVLFQGAAAANRAARSLA